MRAAHFLALVASFSGVRAASSTASAQSYIVELADGHDAASFYALLAESGIKASPRHNMDSSLFTGISFDLEDAAAVVKLVKALPMVKKLWPNQAQTVDVETFAVSRQEGGAQAHLHARQNANANDTWSTHVMTQVDRLRAEGITGKGVKLSIVDSGVDFKHPALGGCFGPGCLVSYGYDLIDNKPEPSDCNGHGTHVAGIIAARGNNPYGFTGVAPDVTLGVYRVTVGCTKKVFDDVAMMAMNKAYEDGSDVISMSLGLGTRWSEDPVAVLAERLVEKGVIVVAAAGNNGAGGLFAPLEGSPAVGHGVAAVGSVVNILVPQNLTKSTYTVGTSTRSGTDFGWRVGFRKSSIPWAGTWPLYATSRNGNVTDDACTKLPADTPDLSKYVVLVRIGSCTQLTQAGNIKTFNGSRIMFYGPGEITRLIDEFLSVPAVGGVVPQSQGERWLNTLNAGQDVSLHLQPEVDSNTANWTIINSPDPAISGYMATSSSWDMPFELDVKPAFAAPGANILSTWPLDKGGYQILSGTSMATPFVAGVYALLIEARKIRDPAALQRIISSVSRPNTYRAGSSSMLAPVAWQGAGLIQAFDAAKVTTLLSIQSIALNDTDHFQRDHTFTITNTASIPQTYKLGYVNTVTVYTFMPGDLWEFAQPTPPPVDGGASITLSQKSITIPPNTSFNVSLSVTPPQGLNATRLPVYGGYVTINSTTSPTDQLSLPYLGVAGSLYSTPVIDPTEQTYMARDYRQSGPEDSPPGMPQNSTFTVPRPVSAEIPEDLPDEYHIPGIRMTTIVGNLADVHCLIVPLEIDGELETFDVLGYRAVEDFLLNPGVALDRETGFSRPFTGMLSDGKTIVPEGRYEWRILALRLFGDRSKKEDWQTRSFVFNLRYLKE